MKRPAFFQRLLGTALVLAVAALPTTASACSACMGDPNTKTAGAINGAIYIMLGFVAMMLSSLGAFAFYLFRRAQMPVPPHVELTQMMGSQDSAK